MTDIVDRVALVIALGDGVDFPAAAPQDRERYRKRAKPILSEMLRPTDEMLDALHTHVGGPRQAIVDGWVAAIEAGLGLSPLRREKGKGDV